MIKINITGLFNDFDNKKIISVKTHTFSFSVIENNFVNNFKNINICENNILFIKIYNVSSNNKKIDTLLDNNDNIIFYSFIQQISIGININCEYLELNKSFYISDNFNIKKGLTFEIKPINIQTTINNELLYLSLSYCVIIENEEFSFTKNSNIKSNNVDNLKESNTFTNYNYIDINKEFM